MKTITPGQSRPLFCASLLLASLAPAVANAGISASGYSPSHPTSWTATTDGSIGVNSYGSMIINGGSTLTNRNSYIGSLSGGNGTVTVNAATWTSTGDLRVGNHNNSTGQLNIQNLADVFANSVHIGTSSGSTGTVTLSGGASLNSTYHVVVGNGGTGTLNASGAAEVNSQYGTVGANVASTATFSGSGTQWNINEFLTVGFYGDGTLNIQSGADIQVGSSGIGTVRIAEQPGSNSGITIQGNGSTLDTDNGIEIGYDGTGTLDILNGGALTTTTTYGTAYIGRTSGSSGEVTVDGLNSNWTTAGQIVIGNTGATGVLNITDNAVVEAAYVSLNPTTGTLNINTGGLLRISGGELSGISDLTGLNVEFINGASGSYSSLTVDNGLNVSSGSTIAVSGTLDVTSTGTLGGNGQITGNVDNAGTVGPGNSPGTLTIDGDYTQDAAGTLDIELNGTTPGTEHDQLVITGNADLDGTLDVSTLFGFELVEDMTFEILDIDGTRTGTFDGLNQGKKFGDYDGLQLQIDYFGGDGNDVVLTVVPEPTSLVPLAIGGLLIMRRRR